MQVTLAEWLQPSKVSQTISWPGPGLSAPLGEGLLLPLGWSNDPHGANRFSQPSKMGKF